MSGRVSVSRGVRLTIPKKYGHNYRTEKCTYHEIIIRPSVPHQAEACYASTYHEDACEDREDDADSDRSWPFVRNTGHLDDVWSGSLGWASRGQWNRDREGVIPSSPVHTKVSLISQCSVNQVSCSLLEIYLHDETRSCMSLGSVLENFE